MAADSIGPGRLGGVLFAVCFGSAVLLVGVDSQTRPTIDRNQAEKTRRARLGALPSGTVKVDQDSEAIVLDLSADWAQNAADLAKVLDRQQEELKKVTVFRGYDQAGTVTGYAVVCELPDGYSGDIRFILGVRFDAASDGFQVAGSKILVHKETPGLGANIQFADYAEVQAASKEGREPIPNFLRRFIGRGAEAVRLKKDGFPDGIDAITASTITSRAYTNAVRRVLELFDRNRDRVLGDRQAAMPAKVPAPEGRG